MHDHQPVNAGPGDSSLAAAFQRTAARRPKNIAIAMPDGSAALTWAGYAEEVRRVAEGLHAHGVRRGHAVALMMANRPEFYPVDTGALHLGAIPFSIYNTSSPEQIRTLLDSAAPEVVICDVAHLPQVLQAQPGSSLKHVFCVESDVSDARPLAELMSTADRDFDFEATWRAVTAEDVATLIYTSGTTGEPKGVQLTHGSILAEVAATNQILRASAEDRVISFLPSAHIADRWAAHYLQLVCGTRVIALADRLRLLETMAQTRPTMFGAVPQVWQKIRAGIELSVGTDPGRRAAFTQAMEIGREFVRARATRSETPDLRRAFERCDATIFAAVRARLGLDEARIVMSGAAPIPMDVVEFFNALGVPLTDGWGMSELSCLAALNPVGAARIGSVGKALPGVEISRAADGELLVRGPILMKGYLGRPDLTAEVIDPDGWLHTGDIGEIDAEGYVRIVDRKKELIVTASGKNISPAAIEGRIKAACPLIGQVAVIGDDKPFLVALVAIDPDAAKQYSAAQGSQAGVCELADDPSFLALVQEAVTAANDVVSEVEQVRKLAVVPDVWEPGSELLTHTMKLRRRPIAQRYAEVIEALYALPREQSLLLRPVGHRP